MIVRNIKHILAGIHMRRLKTAGSQADSALTLIRQANQNPECDAFTDASRIC